MAPIPYELQDSLTQEDLTPEETLCRRISVNITLTDNDIERLTNVVSNLLILLVLSILL